MVTLKNGLRVKMFPRPGGGYASADPGDEVHGLLGQSNMVGRAAARAGIDDVYAAIAGRVFQYGYSDQLVKPAVHPLDHVNENPGSMGLGIRFSEAILPSVNPQRRVLLVPCAQGSTNLYSDWAPGSTLNNAAKTRLNGAMAQGSGANRLRSISWIQGESDAGAGEAVALQYRSRIQAFYEDLLASVTGMTLDTRFIVGTIKPDKPNANIINDALFDFAQANPAVRFVDLTDLSFFDADHYTAASLYEAGNRFAAAFLGA